MKNMLNRRNRKGFTLAELLIVVAIIAVLVAIMIPVFTGQVTKAQQAADRANLRAGYSEVIVKYLSDGTVTTATTPAAQTDGEVSLTDLGSSASGTVRWTKGATTVKVTFDNTTGDVTAVEWN